MRPGTMKGWRKLARFWHVFGRFCTCHLDKRDNCLNLQMHLSTGAAVTQTRAWLPLIHGIAAAVPRQMRRSTGASFDDRRNNTACRRRGWRLPYRYIWARQAPRTRIGEVIVFTAGRPRRRPCRRTTAKASGRISRMPAAQWHRSPRSHAPNLR